MFSAGKRVGSRTYAHVSLIDSTGSAFRDAAAAAVEISGLRSGIDFDVVRFDAERSEVALLSYPAFFEDLFPALRASWAVYLPTRTTRYRDYSQSLNPPVLHRKELMIPRAHPSWEKLAAQTRLAEDLGLFADPSRIGFQKQWQALLEEKGYSVCDGELRPTGNDAANADDIGAPPEPPGQSQGI